MQLICEYLGQFCNAERMLEYELRRRAYRYVAFYTLGKQIPGILSGTGQLCSVIGVSIYCYHDWLLLVVLLTIHGVYIYAYK